MGGTLRPTAEEAAGSWRALVEADAEQVPRVREDGPGGDHYGGIAARFRAGVRAAPEVDVLTRLAQASDTWLDIGAGGGRLAAPLAGVVRRVIAVEPSPSMREQLNVATTAAGLRNLEVREARWPDTAWSEAVDVSLAAHCLYDIVAVEAFLDAMEQHSRRMCVAVFRPWARGASLGRLFEAVHGETLQTLPALGEFVALLAARGRRYEVHTVAATAEGETTPREEAFAEARRLLWLAEGSPKERRMRALMEEWWGSADGIALPRAPAYIGAVSWTPRVDGSWRW